MQKKKQAPKSLYYGKISTKSQQKFFQLLNKEGKNAQPNNKKEKKFQTLLITRYSVNKNAV